MSSRLYPDRPFLAASVAVFREGRVLLASRTKPPAALLNGKTVDPANGSPFDSSSPVVVFEAVGVPGIIDDILRREKPELDGLELMTNNMDADCRRRAAVVQRERGLAGLGSSDAHQEDVLGVCYTEFDAQIRTSRELVEAIRGRRAVALERQTDRIAS